MALGLDIKNDIFLWAWDLAVDNFKKEYNTNNVPWYGITEVGRCLFSTCIFGLVPPDSIEVEGINQVLLNDLWKKYPDLEKEDIIVFTKYRIAFAHIFYDALCIAYSNISVAVTIDEVYRALPALKKLKLSKGLYDILQTELYNQLSKLLNWNDLNRKPSRYIS